MHNVSAILKPVSHSRVYDLVRDAGLDVSGWSDYKRSEHPASNPNFCYEWAFEGTDRVIVCLWFQEMQISDEIVFQNLNYQAIAAARHQWDATQRKRAGTMDHAIQIARIKRIPIRVIVVDGSRRSDGDDESRSTVERRFLDSVPWHVASYDDDGNCRLQRGPWPAPPETFTPAEISAAGSFAEGAKAVIATQVRERSQRLRELARAHYAAQSVDGRIRCAACDWSPPLKLELTSPIVEIHHGFGISTYPTDGKALTFEIAIKHLTPLCPNCHRMAHAKPGGGTFTLAELQMARI
jgi:5-methylcytosine-specific restriction protein A/putative restriction endonuclease